VYAKLLPINVGILLAIARVVPMYAHIHVNLLPEPISYVGHEGGGLFSGG
jgi:hypothetical protein